MVQLGARSSQAPRPQRQQAPTLTLTAQCLAAMRAEAWCEPQLVILDMLIDALEDQYADAMPAFDAERFSALAHHHQYRLTIPRKVQP